MEVVGDQILEVSEDSSKISMMCNNKEKRKVRLEWEVFVGRKGKLHSRNGRAAMLCVISTSVDTLFFYILFVDEDRMCIGFDYKLRTIAVILRSFFDFLYLTLTLYHFHGSYTLLHHQTDAFLLRARKFLLSSSRLGFLALLPLPQLVALFVVPNFKGLHFIYAIRTLSWVLIIQYLSRIYSIYSYLMKSGWRTFLPHIAQAKAAFNLILYLLASHVVGGIWYLSTIERKTVCWQGRCQYCPLNCNYIVGVIANNSDNFCSVQPENGSKVYNFGVFQDALPIVNSTDFFPKIFYCSWWGLQKLSSFGQDLRTSKQYLLEIFFVITITISGLVLFALLIGNLQTYLQSTIISLEKIRSKEQGIEKCMTEYCIPWELKKRIRRCKFYKQPEVKYSDGCIEHLLQNLPNHISREVKQHLCSTSLFNVLLKLENMDERVSNAIYDLMKPKRCTQQTFIVHEGGAIDELVFIIQGKVLASSKKDKKAGELNWLTKGQFYGEELVDWAINCSNFPSLPISTKTIYALTDVQVFVLVANDLKTLISKIWYLLSKNDSPNLRERWKDVAALVLQSAWRQYNQAKHLKQRSKKDLI